MKSFGNQFLYGLLSDCVTFSTEIASIHFDVFAAQTVTPVPSQYIYGRSEMTGTETTRIGSDEDNNKNNQQLAK